MESVTSMGRQPSWSIRLADVRFFAQHLAHFDLLTEVPPSDAVPAASALRRWTYHCLFGLIAVAGLHHSEALGLLRPTSISTRAFSPSERQSSVSHGWSRCMPRQSLSFQTMPPDAMHTLARRAVPIFSSPNRAADCYINTCTACSGEFPGKSEYGRRGIAMATDS